MESLSIVCSHKQPYMKWLVPRKTNCRLNNHHNRLTERRNLCAHALAHNAAVVAAHIVCGARSCGWAADSAAFTDEQKKAR